MTRQEMDAILSYFAQNFISPLCTDRRTASEIWLEQSGEKFRALYQFMSNMQKESTTTLDIRRASDSCSVSGSVTVSNVSELTALSDQLGHDLILTTWSEEYDPDDPNTKKYSIIVYDDYLE